MLLLHCSFFACIFELHVMGQSLLSSIALFYVDEMYDTVCQGLEGRKMITIRRAAESHADNVSFTSIVQIVILLSAVVCKL